MSLQRERSTNPQATDSRSVETTGHLADTPVPELLAHAHRVAFSGTLVLDSPSGEPARVRFIRGSVDHASPVPPALQWKVLSHVLPPEMQAFAAEHAGAYQLDPFAAVERLLLLPRASLDSAREIVGVLAVEAMCELSLATHYAFVSKESDSRSVEPGLSRPIEPLGLIAACVLVGSYKERAAQRIATFEDAYLAVDSGTSLRSSLDTLTGPMRRVVECLVHSPESVRALRERKVVSPDQLVACLHALWLTRQVTIGARSSPPPSAEDLPKGPASNSSLPRAINQRLTSQSGTRLKMEVTEAGARSSRPPPEARPAPETRPRSGAPAPTDSLRTRSSVPPQARATSSVPPHRSSFAPSDRVMEAAMEHKVDEAWILAQAEPERTERTSALVVKAISVFPRNPRMRYCLACLHRQANRVDDAVKELERVLDLDPTDQQARDDLTELRRSVLPRS